MSGGPTGAAAMCRISGIDDQRWRRARVRATTLRATEPHDQRPRGSGLRVRGATWYVAQRIQLSIGNGTRTHRSPAQAEEHRLSGPSRCLPPRPDPDGHHRSPARPLHGVAHHRGPNLVEGSSLLDGRISLSVRDRSLPGADARGNRSAVGVGAVREAHDPDQHLVIVDRVDHSVLAPAGGPVALQIEPQGLADSVRIGGERPEQEDDDGDGHCFWGGRVRWRVWPPRKGRRCRSVAGSPAACRQSGAHLAFAVDLAVVHLQLGLSDLRAVAVGSERISSVSTSDS